MGIENSGELTATGRHTFSGLGLSRASTVIATIALLFLAGCRVSVQVPVGGQVLSDQGLVCSAGQTCVIEVATTSYLETFTAQPAPGYVFTQWHEASGYLCGGSEMSCTVATAFMEGRTALLGLLDADFEVIVQPVFEADADTDRYDVAEWQSFLQTVRSPSYTSNSFLYQVLPDPGNCDGGVLKAAATGRFLYALNLIRKLHNLPAVDYDTSYNAQMQAANLVQIANNYFTHQPEPGDTCYTTDADTGAGSSNISWSSWQGDPADHALGWTNDNHNVSSLMAAGHRRWVLLPNLGYTSYGQISGHSSMKVHGFSSAPGYTLPQDLEYVAFPYRNYPHVMVEQGGSPTPWSISMVPASGYGNYPYFTSASVTVTEVATGNTLNVHSLYNDNIGYGLPNFLSWMVAGWQYDTAYTVTINNVQMPGGSVMTVEYPVEIDYTELQ